MPNLDRTPAAARANAPAEELGRKVIKQRVTAAAYYWERVAGRKEPRNEDIHQLRVWSRRAIAALELFAPLLPAEPTAELRRVLNKARKRAGSARDCDVLKGMLDKQTRQLLAAALDALSELRQQAAERLARGYRKQVKSGHVRKQLKLLHSSDHIAGQNGKSPPPLLFGPWFQLQFAEAAQEFATELRRAQAASRRIHVLRIAGKRVRYALEIGLPSLPKGAGKSLYAALEKLQSQLGEVCDHQALAERFRELAADIEPAQRSQLLKTAKKHSEQAQTGIAKIARWWKGATGRKKLLALLADVQTSEVVAVQRARPRVQRRKSQEK